MNFIIHFSSEILTLGSFRIYIEIVPNGGYHEEIEGP